MISKLYLTSVDDEFSVKKAITDTLKYFHTFSHPLYAEEVHKFMGTEMPLSSVKAMLSEMVRDEVIFLSHNMYALENSSQLFLKRLVGADIANEKMKDARKCARIIATFPFVKCVCVSGSLSKGYADESSDIDFFIITTAKRLWICRTMLHLFKKLTFLVNRQHSFCMNYFIDESALRLEEQNIFTATELTTLIPVFGFETHRHLIAENNDWITSFFPNQHTNTIILQTPQHTSKVKLLTEWLLNRLAPQKTNNFLMRLTDKLWRYKWEKRNYPMEDYDIAMKTKWYVSKQHPLNYQKKVLNAQAHSRYNTIGLDIN